MSQISGRMAGDLAFYRPVNNLSECRCRVLDLLKRGLEHAVNHEGLLLRLEVIKVEEGVEAVDQALAGIEPRPHRRPEAQIS